MIKDCRTRIKNFKISKGKETHKGMLFFKYINIYLFIVSLTKITDQIKGCLTCKLKSYTTYDPR
jgi:hypothetical protein